MASAAELGATIALLEEFVLEKRTAHFVGALALPFGSLVGEKHLISRHGGTNGGGNGGKRSESGGQVRHDLLNFGSLTLQPNKPE